MKKLVRMVPVCLLSVFAGCVSNEYASWGEFETHDERKVSAVLYWKGQKKVDDSQVAIWRCEALPLPFVPGQDGSKPLYRMRESGDEIVVSIEELGFDIEIGALAEDACAFILVDGRPVMSASSISPGDNVTIAVLCENPERYPKVGVYEFGSVHHDRTVGWFGPVDPEPPDPCEGPEGEEKDGKT